MAFNHYAKIKRILSSQPSGWYIKIIEKPTTSKNFAGEIMEFDHYYRIFDVNNNPIKYCKFQQIELLAKILGTSAENLPIIK